MNPLEFRAALGSFATGVTVITTCGADGLPAGVTANSFNSVSLDPPMVLWSLARTSRALGAFLQANHFAVHVLGEDQQDLAMRFASSGEDKFAGLDCPAGAGGVPLLADCAARFECRTAHQYDGGDHVILVGKVDAFESTPKRPLLFHQGRFGRVDPTA